MVNKKILWKKPNLVKILSYLSSVSKENIQGISNNTEIIHSNCSTSLSELKEIDLIMVEQTEDKRKIFFKLTENGKKVASKINEINELLI